MRHPARDFIIGALKAAGSLAALAAVAGVAILALIDTRQPRNIYMVPQGYVGWLCVEFGAESQPALAIDERGYRILRFDETGIIRTSSLGLPGHDYRDEFFRVDENGKRQRANDVGQGGFSYTPDMLSPRHAYWLFTWAGEASAWRAGAGRNVGTDGDQTCVLTKRPPEMPNERWTLQSR